MPNVFCSRTRRNIICSYGLLFTDLSNPTSNYIYQAIGYKPVCDVDEYKFL